MGDILQRQKCIYGKPCIERLLHVEILPDSENRSVHKLGRHEIGVTIGIASAETAHAIDGARPKEQDVLCRPPAGQSA
jgi:hypothetical protein